MRAIGGSAYDSVSYAERYERSASHVASRADGSHGYQRGMKEVLDTEPLLSLIQQEITGLLVAGVKA